LIYADANVVIRLVEGDAPARAPIESRLLPLRDGSRFLLTSRLTRLECRVKPLREGDPALLSLYDAFFSGAEVTVVDLTVLVIEMATELRASFKVTTPDALHLASAIVAGAEAFLTGDQSLARCTQIPVEVL
jgi:predicted nucleic acid-binding protein